jgi:hypothetical protein
MNGRLSHTPTKTSELATDKHTRRLKPQHPSPTTCVLTLLHNVVIVYRDFKLFCQETNSGNLVNLSLLLQIHALPVLNSNGVSGSCTDRLYTPGKAWLHFGNTLSVIMEMASKTVAKFRTMATRPQHSEFHGLPVKGRLAKGMNYTFYHYKSHKNQCKKNQTTRK